MNVCDNDKEIHIAQRIEFWIHVWRYYKYATWDIIMCKI